MTIDSASAGLVTRAFEFWGGALGTEHGERLELQLDAAALAAGRARGVARLVGSHGCTLLETEGERSDGVLRLRLNGPGNGAAYALEARREGDAYAGVLRRDGAAAHDITLHRHTPGASAPPPPAAFGAAPEDLPVNVTYDAVVDGTHLHFGDWSFPVIPVPTGSWSGAPIWGTNSGLVTATWLPLRGPNVSGQILFTMSTWNPFSHVGYLYVNRWDVEDEKPVKIEPDSSVYWSDRWVYVTSGTVTMHRNPR